MLDITEWPQKVVENLDVQSPQHDGSERGRRADS
jgi:hypothetical protein